MRRPTLLSTSALHHFMPPAHPTPSPLDQARRFLQEGRPAQARDAALRILRRTPSDLNAIVLLGYVCAELGDTAQSLYYLEKAASLAPASAPVWANLGNALVAAGRAPEAIQRLASKAESLKPHEDLFAALVNAFAAGKQAVSAAMWAERGLAHFPDSRALLLHLSGARLLMGDAAGALEPARRAAALHPDDPTAAAQVLTLLNYCEPGIQNAAPEKPAAFGALLQQTYDAHGSWQVTPDPDRLLRVGFVSADLRAHACAFFIEPLFSSLDRAAFEIIAYSVTAREDARSAELRQLASLWRHLPGSDARSLAAQIRDDRVDVLIDLSGLTVGHRLPTFAMRPAPLQLTYLGYPGSTGLTAIDGRIVDSITDPIGSEPRATERLIRIDPCFLCYAGVPDAVVDAVPPSQRAPSNSITFGSFNALQKMSPPIVRLWSAALRAVPGSRLAIKYTSTGDPGIRARLMQSLADAGIDAERVSILEPRAGYREHLECYNQVDIALDTFPYHGTTTTCEALWMGVPVVTLASLPHTHAARVGASLLSAVGLPDLVAPSEERFVSIAASLAADRTRLADLRAGLRARMSASPLCDRAAFGRRFGEAVRSAWTDWCRSAAGTDGRAPSSRGENTAG